MDFDVWAQTEISGHTPSDDTVQLRLLRRCWAAAQKESRAEERERCYYVAMRAPFRHEPFEGDPLVVDVALKAMAFDICAQIGNRGMEPFTPKLLDSIDENEQSRLKF